MPAFKQIVATGPELAFDKVVRWRCAGFKRVLAERFAVAVHARTVGKFLNAFEPSPPVGAPAAS